MADPRACAVRRLRGCRGDGRGAVRASRRRLLRVQGARARVRGREAGGGRRDSLLPRPAAGPSGRGVPQAPRAAAPLAAVLDHATHPAQAAGDLGRSSAGDRYRAWRRRRLRVGLGHLAGARPERLAAPRRDRLARRRQRRLRAGVTARHGDTVTRSTRPNWSDNQRIDPPIAVWSQLTRVTLRTELTPPDPA